MGIQVNSNVFSDQRNQAANTNENLKEQSYSRESDVETPRGADDQAFSKVVKQNGRRSLFNTFHAFTGVDDNDFSRIWTDEDVAGNREWMNPTITNLLNSQSRGVQFDSADFRYCKYYGEVPNNRLITLRRFPFPVADDIYSNYERTPDIARMVTWSTQDENPFNELIDISFGLRWKPLESVSEQGQWIGDPKGADGYLQSVMNIMDGQYGQGAVDGENRLNFDPQHDQNKVYGPVDALASTHIRDIGLNFEMPITLTFRYELAGIDGVNPKTAMIDLLSNILAVTTNDAKFWGGARYWVGYKPSSFAKKLREDSDKEFSDSMNKSHVDMKSFVGGIAQRLSESFGDSNNISDIAQNISNMAFGKMLDKVGRASIPTINSLLTGEPVGMHHVTIGNPLRPIMSIGNLILENTTITFDEGPLGFDDFPTALKVVCTCKHAMPRGRAEIETMFNAGKSRTYWKPTENELRSLKNGLFQKSSLQSFIDKEVDWATKSIFSFAQQKN